MKSIGERIKEIRKNLGINQSEFANGLGLSRQQVSFLEKGERSLTERTLNDISREYGVNKDFILTGEGDMFIDLSKSEELIKFVNGLCENDPEKAELLLDIYYMFNELSEKEQKVIKDLIEVMLEKKHPTE